MVGPPPLRPEEVPNDLKCSICFGVPLSPKLTPCDHVFCDECVCLALAAATGEQPLCPNCRAPCAFREVIPIQRGSLIYRIWSGILVKCPDHDQGCAWTGSIVDAADHMKSCRHDHVDQPEIKRLSERIAELESDHRLNLPILFEGSYDFDRFSVVKLSQLVSRYLEDKPPEIDSCKIYNCVRSCYLDLKRNWDDNPEHYHLDMRMLLSTCAASTWFSKRQSSNIFSWLKEQGWG